jgi:hypothetical protein
MRVLLNPYVHELHWSGEKCAEDCPACRWVREELKVSRKRSAKKLPKSEVSLVTRVRAFESTQQGL